MSIILLEGLFWLGVIMLAPLTGYLTYRLSHRLWVRLFTKTYVELVFSEGDRKCRLVLDASGDYKQTAIRRLQQHGFREPTVISKRFYRNSPNPD